MSQTDVALRTGISQGHVSHLERGQGRTASIETWAVVAAAVGEQLVGFLEHAPGASLPRDIEHLRRQSTLIRIAADGGWSSLPEFRLD
jgi:transcriptional regulator with XRE-family HTH domain